MTCIDAFLVLSKRRMPFIYAKPSVSNTRPSRIFCAARDKFLNLKVNYKTREQLRSVQKKLLVCSSAIPVRISTLCSCTAGPVASRVTDLAAKVEKQLVIKEKELSKSQFIKNAASRVASAINDCSSNSLAYFCLFLI